MWTLLSSESASGSSLQALLEMHFENGSSLPVGRQLYRFAQSQILPSISVLCHCTLISIQLGLALTWITLCLDAYMDWKYVSTFREPETARYLMIACIVCSILLSLSIGSLLVGQLMGLSSNLTTLETFIPNIEQHVIA